MELEEAKATVIRFAQEIRDLRDAAAEANAQADARSKIVSGYLDIFPDLRSLVPAQLLLPQAIPHAASDGSPRGAEAVRVILQERPNYWWYISEVVAALRERGWMPDSDNPANAVRTACERLLNMDDSDVHKGRGSSGKVVYAYRPDDEPWDGVVAHINDIPAPFDPNEEPF